MQEVVAMGVSETERHQIEGVATGESHRLLRRFKVRMGNNQTERNHGLREDRISRQKLESRPHAELRTVRMARERLRRALGPVL